MAAFSDQFSRLDPLSFEGSGPFELLISTVAVDARTFLADERHVSDLVAICRALEGHLSKRIPNTSARIAIAMEEVQAVGDTDEVLKSCSELPPSIRAWEIYAALSLWKLIDAMDLLDAIDGAGQDMESLGWAEVNSTIAMASTALQIGSRLLGMAFGDSSSALAAFQARSEKSKQILRIRWKDRDEHMEFALSLIPKFNFRSRAKTARAIVDEIQTKFDRTYGDEIVDGWLKKAGWKRPI